MTTKPILGVRILCTILLLIFLLYIYLSQFKIKRNLKLPSLTCKASEYTFGNGDILLFFEHGQINSFPGHMAIIVQLPQYKQLFVWDMPNPLFHSPDLLKPLHIYIENAKKHYKGEIFVQSLQGPYVNLIPAIRYLSACSHFDLMSGFDYFNDHLQNIFAMPRFPSLLPEIHKPNYYYCSNAVWTVLIKAKIMNKSILNIYKIFFPYICLQHDFNINEHVDFPFCYQPLITVV